MPAAKLQAACPYATPLIPPTRRLRFASLALLRGVDLPQPAGQGAPVDAEELGGLALPELDALQDLQDVPILDLAERRLGLDEAGERRRDRFRAGLRARPVLEAEDPAPH